MRTHVIILCQGNQTRLGIDTRKQLLPLPYCANTPILFRTIQMVAHHLDDPDRHAPIVTVVGWSDLCAEVRKAFADAPFDAWIRAVNLLDPGNSSLKGCARFLASSALEADLCARLDACGLPMYPNAERTVVLLGDVIYSHDVLEHLLRRGTPADPTQGTIDVPRDITVCHSDDLSQGGGELWGLAWNQCAHVQMMMALGQALATHPPFHDTYQPGQMRQWFFQLGERARMHASVATTEHHDYIKDVDVPADLDQIEWRSERAAFDDAKHGMVW